MFCMVKENKKPMKRFYLFTIIFFMISMVVSASSWEYHLSKLHTYQVVRGNNRIYFLSEGGIFYYDKLDNSIDTYTKIEGLSGSDFSGIEYSHATNSLVVYYQNSVIDVIPDDGQPRAYLDIKNKPLVGNKSIYNATCVDGLCYLSCGFGIVVVDLVNKEIKDSFIIGQDGNYEAVYDVTLDDNYIYAATQLGVKFAEIDSPNLLDFNNWTYIDHVNLKEAVYTDILNINGRIWCSFEDDEWSVDRVASQHGPETWYYEFSDLAKMNSLTYHGADKIVTGRLEGMGRPGIIRIMKDGVEEDITEYRFEDYDGTPYNTDTIAIDPRYAVFDSERTVWIADWNYGAVRYRDGKFDLINPGGPIDNNAFSMHFADNKLWIVKGGIDKAWDNLYEEGMIQSYLHSELKWEALSKFTNPELENYKDIVDVISAPGEPNHIFVATWGGGLLEFNNGVFIGAYNEANSSLNSIFPGDYFTRIGGMDIDSKGNLWVSNSEVEKGLHKVPYVDIASKSKWEAIETPEVSFDYKLGKVLVTSDDNVWMVVPRDKTYGLYVVSNDGRNRRHVNVTSYFKNSETELKTEMNDVYDIAEDKDGKLWVATSFGVTYYSRPEEVFEKEEFYADQPGLDENDGYYHPLLATETVTSLAIDGGNRKYCGTKNSGVYLISADGKNEIKHYTVENSDLISNSIVSLQYDGVNGILYIGTDLGLVSIRTQSREAYDHFTDVYAYPNPVRSSYDGDIYIKGMMEDSNVKITNISGRLVYETTSVGGQATWDGRDLAGNKVHTGVYLVFCASSDGSESVVTKILFIRPPQ